MPTPCGPFQESLPSLADGALNPEEERRVREHLVGCPACRRALEAEQATKALLRNRLRAVEPPPGLQQRILVRIGAERHRPAQSWRSWLPASPTVRLGHQKSFAWLLPVPLGMMAAAFSLFLVERATPGVTISPTAWWTIALLWSGLFAGSFSALLLSWPPLTRAARAALVGATLAIPLAAILPIPAVVAFAVQHLPAANALSVHFPLVAIGAAVYSGVPILLGGLLMGVGERRTWLESGALYLAMLAPAVYLQCMLLAFAFTLMWVLGATLGALGSAPMGFWLYRRLVLVR